MKTEYEIFRNELLVHCNRKIIRGTEPYFFVKANAKIPSLIEIVRVEDTNRLSLYGDKLKCIITKTPYDVGKIRTHFDWTGEADIRYTKRYNIDNNIRQNNSNMIFIDIETVTPRGAEPDSNGRYPISMIGVYNILNDVYHQWVFHPKLFIKTMEIPWKNRKSGHVSKRYIHQFNHEKLMLIDFMSYIMYHKPDVIAEYSKGKLFDMSNIIHRMIVHDINYKSLSPINRVKIDKHIDIGGIETISVLPYYKKHHIGELENDKLDYVCKKEFGIGKTEIITDFEKAWNDDLQGLLNYNCGDVESLVNLNRETKLFDDIQYIINYIGCELEDYLSPTSIIRHYLLKKAKEYNVVLDTWKYETILSFRGYDENLFKRDDITLVEYRKKLNTGLIKVNRYMNRTQEKSFIKKINNMYKTNIFTIAGAHVMEPKQGLHENVDLFDFRSMYPNIIIKYNMSPETMVRYEDKDKYNKNDLFDIGNGVYFLKQHVKQGFLPRVLIGLFDMRYNVKNKMKGLDKNSKEYKILDNQQKGIKYLINSFYGVMKFICIWIAESITYIGRNLIKWTAKLAEENGCMVLYGDTDSIYINGNSKGFNTLFMTEMKKKYGFTIELEHEGYYPKVFFITKKRYVIQDKNGEFKYKGIEIKRSENTELVKSSQAKAIRMLFDGSTQDEIFDYLKEQIKEIPNMKPTFLARKIRLNFDRKNGNTKFEKSAINANSFLHKHYKTGDKPYYLPGICFDYDNEVVITEQIVPDLVNEFINKMNLIFSPLGWDVNDLRSKYKQRRLEI